MSIRVITVDENDNQIGLKTYDELQYGDIYRVSALWLTDTMTGNILVAQRKWTEFNDPGKWSTAVAGTIEEGETYDENIVHEIEEEIGLKDALLKTGVKQYVDDGEHKYFCQWYIGEVDATATSIVIQEDEVEDITWISKADLINWTQEQPEEFVPSIKNTLSMLGIV